jgi:hypothetical protein
MENAQLNMAAPAPGGNRTAIGPRFQVGHRNNYTNFLN